MSLTNQMRLNTFIPADNFDKAYRSEMCANEILNMENKMYDIYH